MNFLLKLAFLFAAGCLIGWGIEVLFRRFSPSNKSRRWINPGFLNGPYLPLYGFSLCLLYCLALLEPYFNLGNSVVNKLVLFLVMSVVVTAVEFVAGLIFIKGMHVKLWDYSQKRGNIMGIICPQFSLAWAALGAVYYFLIHPHILSALEWFASNLAFSFFIGLFYGVFSVDVWSSFRIAAKIRRFADENKLLVYYEELKEQIRATAETRKQKYRFLFALRSDTPLKEHLKNILDRHDKSKNEQ